jgi:glutaconate CoA-transferase, subunit A
VVVIEKLVSMREAVERVANGSTVAIGGLLMNGAPMDFCRALVRRGARDLTAVAIVAGPPVDWLIAGGCLRRVVTGLVSYEGFGLAPHFRRAAERGEVDVQEWSEWTMICGLQAAAAGLPFMPTKAGVGTDMPGIHPGATQVVEHERGTFLACGPIRPDVAVVHVHEADRTGNCRVLPKLVWMDSELVKAAETVIVTAERIVPERTFRAAPERTTYPGFAVDLVVEAPLGAYPTALFPWHGYDGGFVTDYLAACRDAETFAAFWRDRVVAPPDGPALVDANGGAGTLLRIRAAAGGSP